MPRALMRRSTGSNIRVSGEPVKNLQEGPVAAGCPVGAVDGIFGVDTDRAVRKWQSPMGRAQDGVVLFGDWTAIAGRPVPSCPDSDIRAVIAEVVAGNGRPESVADVLGRKMTWTTGTRTVQGSVCDLRDRGPGEFPA